MKSRLLCMRCAIMGVVCAAIVACGVAWTVGYFESRFEFGRLRRELLQGAYALNQELGSIALAAKPITDLSTASTDGHEYSMMVFSYDYSVLELYGRDGRLVGAKLVEGVYRSRVQWIIYDSNAMDSHAKAFGAK